MLLTQYSILDNINPDMLPGRIYLNGQLIDLKSQEEKIILKALKKHTIAQELKEMDIEIEHYLKDTFKRLCTFFESDAAVEVKQKVDSRKKQ